MPIGAAVRYPACRSFALHVVTSLITGVVATTVAAPFDLIKSRTMASSDPADGFASILLRLLRHEGPLALFNGWLPTYFRLGPHAILTFPLVCARCRCCPPRTSLHARGLPPHLPADLLSRPIQTLSCFGCDFILRLHTEACSCYAPASPQTLSQVVHSSSQPSAAARTQFEAMRRWFGLDYL